MTDIDPTAPFTQDLLRALATTVRAQPDETDAEYAARFQAVTTAWAAFRPRDAVEQILAAQIVASHHAALDSLRRAMEAEDPAVAERQRRSYAMTMRTMRDTMRALTQEQQRPDESLAAPPPAIEPPPPLRHRPPAPPVTHTPMNREKTPAPLSKDPSKMTDAELQAALADMRAQAAVALFDRDHPMHRETLRMLPEVLPGIVVPDAWIADPIAPA
jgi:hypothetical protein